MAKLNRKPIVNQSYESSVDPLSKFSPRNRKTRKSKGELPSTKVDGLNAQQRLFLVEYLKDYNGKEAAIRAGYPVSSAHNYASVLLKTISVRKALLHYETDLASRFINSKERVLKEMSLLAYSDLSQYTRTDEHGNVSLRDINTLPPQITRAIKKFSFNRTIHIEPSSQPDGKDKKTVFEKGHIELYDKKAALDMMGKEIGMFRDRTEITGADGKPLMPESTTIILDFGG